MTMQNPDGDAIEVVARASRPCVSDMAKTYGSQKLTGGTPVPLYSMRDSIFAARKAGPTLQADGLHTFEFNFSADDPTFAGHFPNRPILPGIFQLEIARMAAEWILNCQLSVQEIAKAKFQRPILPGEILKLNLKLSGVENAIFARGNFICGGQPAGEAFLKLCRNK